MVGTAAPASSSASSSLSTASVKSSSPHSSATKPVPLPVTTETTFKCNPCDLFFKNGKGLKIHIGKKLKSSNLKTPEKERSISVLEEPILTLTPVTEDSREEINIPLAESTFNAEGDEAGQSEECLRVLGAQIPIPKTPALKKLL